MRARTAAALTAGAMVVVWDQRRRALLRQTRLEWDLRPEDDLPGREWRVTTADGADLLVTDSGPSDGPQVVLAHCWTGSRRVWAPVARRLVEAGCRVVRWDQRGHGASTVGADGCTVAALGDDLAQVISEAKVSNAVLAGHSMGGMTIQSLVDRHPGVFASVARGVVLVSTASHGLTAPQFRAVVPVVGQPAPNLVRNHPVIGMAVSRSVFGHWASWDDLRLTGEDYAATPPEVRAAFARSFLAMDLRPALAGIGVPTTVMVGSRDSLTPPRFARALRQEIPRARLVLLTGAGHMLPFETPDVVANTVLAHVARAPGPWA